MSEKIIRLCEECTKGNLKNVKKMIQGSLFSEGIPVNSTSNVKISMISGMTPLMCACMFGRIKVAEYLIEAGADVNAGSTGSGNTALIYAASNNNLEIVKLLLKHNADKTLKNREGMDAVQFAEKNKFSAVVSELKGISADGKFHFAGIASLPDGEPFSSVISKKIAAPPEDGEICEHKRPAPISREQLITLRLLLGGAMAWGKLNGNPAGNEYPQYNKVREIGKKVYAENGFTGVRQIMDLLRTDGSDLHAYLELMWNNLQNDRGEDIWITPSVYTGIGDKP